MLLLRIILIDILNFQVNKHARIRWNKTEERNSIFETKDYPQNPIQKISKLSDIVLRMKSSEKSWQAFIQKIIAYYPYQAQENK